MSQLSNSENSRVATIVSNPENSRVAARVAITALGQVLCPESDLVAVEQPLELRFHGKPASVLMRTPGHDRELALGYLFHEGIITSLDQVQSIDRPEGESGLVEGSENILEILLDTPSRVKGLDRFFFSTSSCGVCGKKSLDSVAVHGPMVQGNFVVTPSFLSTLADRLLPHQTLFHQTGGVHACGLFTPKGELVCLREDVGRHNAFDKLAGYALEQRLHPLSSGILLLSGRVGYEMAQKAIVSGIPMVIAVGAPTSLAVELCEQWGITLVGFLRGKKMNVYTHPERISAE